MAQGKHSREGLAHDKQYLEMERIATNKNKSSQDYIDMLKKKQDIRELSKSMKT